MQLLSDFFKYFYSKSSSLPLIIMIILLVALLALLIVILVTIISIKKKNQIYSSGIQAIGNDPLPPSALQSNQQNNNNVTQQLNTDIFMDNNKSGSIIWLLGERLNQFLINNGYIQVNKMIKSFFNANQYLKSNFGSKYKYSLPWFAIVGTSYSGKSSLLQGFTQDELENKNNDALSWWFLKNGVVLDVSGNMFLESDTIKGSDNSWNTLIRILYRYRAKKPINGIILTIPANELYGKNKLSIDDIKQRAHYIAKKLHFTQLYFGIKLPIYIVITKTDIIPGFQSFCSEIPVRNRNNMLGWSSPFTLDTVYNPNMLNLAFDELENELNEIRLEIFAENLMSSMKDGIFVFPSELLTVKESLSIYINTIFKDTSFSESGYFRGFYFTGDSKMIPLEKLPSSNGTSINNASNNNISDSHALAIMGTPDADINEVGNISASFQDEEYISKKIFFFEDLLLTKVFQEDSIATPMKNKLNKTNKVIFTSKILLVLTVFLGTYCLFSSADTLNNNKNNLYPSLYQLSSIIKESNELDYKNLQYEDNNKLANCSNQLLSIIQKINKVDFNSKFIPASWFSDINSRIKDTLSESYKKVIIRAVYINLLLKAKSLLENQLPNKSSTLEESFDPFKSKEYLQLQQYLTDFLLLENNINKFENLKTFAEPKDLNDLIKYTLNASLPNDFLKNYNDLKTILSNTSFPSLDIKSYKQVAYNNFVELLKNFVNSVFFTTSNTNVVSHFNSFINKLLKTNLKDLPSCKAVKEFSRALTLACNGLDAKNSDMYNTKLFEKNDNYKLLLKNIETLFGKEAMKQTNDIIINNVNYLREQLGKLNRQLLENQLHIEENNNISKNNSNNQLSDKEKNSNKDNNDTNEVISSGIFELEANLRRLCSECFMEESEETELITEVPDNKIMYWDMSLIDKTISISLKYDEFCNSYLDNFPECIKDGLSVIARNNLYSVIKNTIAKAQIISNIPNDITNNDNPEEILSRQISELKEVAPKLTKLMEILKPDRYNKLFNNLNKLISKIGISLLNNIDKLLKGQKPYMPTNLTFEYWDGQTGGGLYLYSACDLEELELYLQVQRSLVNKLAIEFAQPIVNFLNSIKYSNNNLLSKWSKIIEDYNDFSRKDLKNPVNVLENFIKTTLNECTIDNIKDLIPIKDIQNNTSDYFLSVARDIKISILSRAEVLIRQRNIVRYEKLREYYKKYLENFYPFKNPQNEHEIIRDADLELVKGLINIYDEYGGTPEKLLDAIYQLDEGKEVYKFIKKIHLFKELFGDLLNNNHGEIIKLKMEADFSVNKGDEINTEYLVDRIFKPNYDTNIEDINPNKFGIWYFGEPIEFNLRWAEDDEDAPNPLYNPKDSNLSVEKTTAKIKCNGAWSLLRFLQKYKSSLNYNKIRDANQNVLEFNIPLNDSKTARLFLGITVFKPQQSDSALSESIAIPSVPGKMPPISQKILDLSNTPVLINRIIGKNPSSDLQSEINTIIQNNKKESIDNKTNDTAEFDALLQTNNEEKHININTNKQKQIQINNKSVKTKDIPKTAKPKESKPETKKTGKSKENQTSTNKSNTKPSNKKNSNKNVSKKKKQEEENIEDINDTDNNKEELIQEDTSVQVEEILNSNEAPVLKEEDALITISERPIG
ncbi:MAG: hypothetical protein IJ848_00855 [Alphaproteobacteria bacterium]|nr:hypothetical protein [Alphaproteobacteria bacterium]